MKKHACSFMIAISIAVLAFAIWIHPSHFGLNKHFSHSVFQKSKLYQPWLARIRQERVIPVGFVPWFYPFSYRENQSAQGFSVQFTERVVDVLGEELGIPNLTTQWKPMALPKAPDLPYPALANREVAFECNTTLALADHPTSTILTDPFFISGIHVLSPRDRAVRSTDDVRGKSLLGQEGAFQRFVDHRLNAELGLEIGITPYPILQYATVLISENKAYAIVGDALRLFNLSYALPNNGIAQWVASLDLGEVGYACSLLAGESELRDVLNRAIYKILAEESYQRFYYRWFINEHPQTRIRLNYPMPEGLRSLLQKQGATLSGKLIGDDLLSQHDILF